MVGRIIFEEDLKSLAAQLIERYPMGYLSEIEIGWPCGIAIRAPNADGLDSPRAIVRGSYQELRQFEIVYERVRAAKITVLTSSELITGIKATVEA